MLTPIISDRKQTAVPEGFPTEPTHRESVQYHSKGKHREEIEKQKVLGNFWETKVGSDFVLQYFMLRFYFFSNL